MWRDFVVRRVPRPTLLIALGGVVVLVALAYGIAFAVVGGGVPPNTTVASASIGKVAIGGMSPAAAERKLTAELGPTAKAPIPVVVADDRRSVDPARAGLSFDAEATVVAAGTRSANPLSLLKSIFGHRTVAPVTAVETASLSAALDRLDESLADGEGGSIRFDGITPVAIPPVKGTGLVKHEAAALLRGAYLKTAEPVELPTQPVPAAVTADAVQRAIETIAKPAVAAPITLLAGSTPVQITPQVIAANLTFAARDGELHPVVDGAGIAAALNDKLAPATAPARDASFDLSSGKPVVVPAVAGSKPDLDKLGPAIAAVLADPPPRQLVVPTAPVAPSFTTDDARSLGIKEKVSSFTTHHPCCAPRVTNIHKMADIVNGYIVKPGATFSLNQVVGERDRARGFVPAPMIFNGLYVDSIGGGVSQFTTTIYNAVFFAGLKDVEHHTHSYYISRYPAGREATVSYPEPNFIFQNDTPTGILIQTSYTGTSITVTFWGTKYYDITSTSSARYAFTTGGVRYNTRTDCEPASGNQGFQIDVTQTFKKDGAVVKTKTLHTRYDPEPVIICGPTPPPSPASAPASSPAPSASAPPDGS
ncbi:MAG TPA: VanW family protein [Micromonosporaceae bacterium]